MIVICGKCGKSLAPDDWCEECGPVRPRRPITNFGMAIVTAAAMRDSGPLDGEHLRAAACASKERPS